MLRSGPQKVLIDAVFTKAMEPYLNHTPETLKRLQDASGEFQGTNLILATHFHADHFDADAVASHLKHNPRASFVGSSQMTEMVLKAMGVTASKQLVASNPERREKVEVNGITVDVLNVMHSGMRPQVRHRGYIVHIGGEKVLHLGDADGSKQNIEPQHLSEDRIDLALVPEWYLDANNGGSTVRASIKPRRLIFIHVPPQDAKEASELANKNFQGAIALTSAGEKHCY